MRIRTASPEDVPLMQAIEAASGAIFREVGMDDIAEAAPLPTRVLGEYQRAGRAWTAAGDDGEPVAFAVVDLIDGCAHVAQLSVRPDHARQGIGRRLLDHVGRWAASRGLPGLTLTTFRSVPWNAPYYERLGFRILAPEEITPGLAAVVAAETAAGLDPAKRVCMRREVA